MVILLLICLFVGGVFKDCWNGDYLSLRIVSENISIICYANWHMW